MSQFVPPPAAGTRDADGAPWPAASEDIAEARERVEDFVRRNPALSLALALAAGYVVGRAFAGITRRL
ncbi:hypothetical protein L6R50_22595 [Myxococcota bacterium]|nr:hypothetical protein [Myxococcota bacterium]